MQFTFGDKGEVHLLEESIILPVTKKERRGEGKISIGPRIKYGHALFSNFYYCVLVVVVSLYAQYTQLLDQLC